MNEELRKKLDETPNKDVLLNIIKTWFDFSQSAKLCDNSMEEVDIFFKFTAAWMSFNAIYELLCSANGDKDSVKNFANLGSYKQKHENFLKDNDYKSAVAGLAKKEIINLKDKSKKATINDINNFEEVLLCVYQVRCNLFHGGKTPYEPRDKDVVDCAYKIVSKIISEVLK